MHIYASQPLPAKDHPDKGPAYRIAQAIPNSQSVANPPPVGYIHHWHIAEPSPGTPENDAILRLLHDLSRTEGGTRYIIYPQVGPLDGIERLSDEDRCALFGIGCPEV